MVNEVKGKAKGGKALAEKMTDQERRDKSMKMVEAKKAKKLLPKATHTGELKIGDISILCHVLNEEIRVISGRGMQNSLGFSKDSSGLALQNIVDSKLLKYLPPETAEKIKNPIQFIRVGSGGSAPDTNGYDATVLIDICDALMQAGNKGDLTPAQKKYAIQASIIIRAVAKVGIIALVDEATGYQRDREKNALAKILEAFVAKELQPYLKAFPADYYEELFRLYDLPFPPKKPQWRPAFFGNITNNVIYARLAPELLPELKSSASKLEKKTRLHQWLTSDVGHPKLREHLASIVTILKLSKNKEEFFNMVDKIHPKFNTNYEIDFEKNE